MLSSKPKSVFISYSHDSDNHKATVRRLADYLLKCGINSTGDFYEEDNPVGGLLDQLMLSLLGCDRVICILTPIYKYKADSLTGGVGYESSIISSEIYKNVGDIKFIPVVIDTETELDKSYPNFMLQTRKALLRKAYDSEEKFFEAIARTILNVPINPKPPLASTPKFIPQQHQTTDVKMLDINQMTQPEGFKDLFDIAKYYADRGDVSSFRNLFKNIRKEVS